MALVETSRPYEVLIRFNEDGTIGSQYQEIQEIRKDGDLVFASLNPPQPLNVEGQPALVDVMQDVAARALQKVSELEEQLRVKADAQLLSDQRIAALESQLHAAITGDTDE